MEGVYHKKDVESNAILRMVHFWVFYSTMEVIILTNLAIQKIKSVPPYILNFIIGRLKLPLCVVKIFFKALQLPLHVCKFFYAIALHVYRKYVQTRTEKIKSNNYMHDKAPKVYSTYVQPLIVQEYTCMALKKYATRLESHLGITEDKGTTTEATEAIVARDAAVSATPPICVFKIFFKAYLSSLQLPLHVCKFFYAIALHVYRKYVQPRIEKIKSNYYMHDKAPKVYSRYVQPLIVQAYMALKKYAPRLESHLGITEDKGTTTEATEAIVARDAAVSATPPILTTATGTTTAHGGGACSEAASNVLDSTNHYGDKVKKSFEHIERKGNKSYGVWLPGRYHREETMSTEGGLLKQFLSFCNNKHQSSQVIVRDDMSLRPLVLPCVNASRVGSDIEASFNASGVPELKHASGSLQPLLLLFHPRRPFRSDVSPPTRIKGGDSIERCEDIIDIVFDNNQVYECKQNVMAAKEFIKKIKELKKK